MQRERPAMTEEKPERNPKPERQQKLENEPASLVAINDAQIKSMIYTVGVRTFFRAFYAAYPSRRRLPSIVSHTVPPSSLKYLILSVLYRLSHPSSISMNSSWETPRQSRP